MSSTFTSQEIRQTFREFFESNNHQHIGSASVIPANDPTLLFINAGMAPLKDYFLGEKIPPSSDLCNVQPCIRTIDIADVGDRHHLTFFEMMGSWSIDNYYKERAIELAFELLTVKFGFSIEKLYVSVYEGDPKLGLAPDDISARTWARLGIPQDHIVFLGIDNFWTAGDTGPCGPCTEVFYDTGAEHGPAYVPGGEFDSTSRYIEIWNAGVFMELNKLPNGSFEPLRFKSVDTGSGLERMSMVLQGVNSAYETDLFSPIISAVANEFSAQTVGEREVRILADHIRSATMILGEGVAPSNEGRGYIPRRLLRKSIAIATQAGVENFNLPAIAEVVIDRMAGIYPQLEKNRSQVHKLLTQEQQDFGRVVRRGLDRLNALAVQPGFVISGADAFTLAATHGMPIDLIRDFAGERGGSVDENSLAEQVAEHRKLSRGAASTTATAGSTGDKHPQIAAYADAETYQETTFIGYDSLTGTAQCLALFSSDQRVTELNAGDTGFVVLHQTPFYPQGGGQVGDTGVLTGADFKVEVLDTLKIHGVLLHQVQVQTGQLSELTTVDAEVDATRRLASMRNHSATHLLHAGLRKTLGEHVKQAGSLVAPERLRFDFRHPQPMTAAEISAVEQLINSEILANSAKLTEVKPYQSAVESGAIAFFGDSYGADVRVVSFGEFSMELCGGTHVGSTAEIGLFRVVSEASVGSGIRRIEALTGAEALNYTFTRDRVLQELSSQLKVSVDQLPQKVAAIKEKAAPAKPALTSGRGFADSVQKSSSGISFLVLDQPEVAAAQLPQAATKIAADLSALTVLLQTDADSSVRVAISVPKSLDGKISAKELLTEILTPLGGRGGGSPKFAQGGAKTELPPTTIRAQLEATLLGK